MALLGGAVGGDRYLIYMSCPQLRGTQWGKS